MTTQEETPQQQQASPETQPNLERYNEDNSSAIAIRSLDDISRISKIFIQSGMFKGDKSQSQAQQVYQAGVKIIAGVEFGVQPFAAMRGINIINGNAEMSANLMAAKVKMHPKYDYRVSKWDGEGCVIKFFEIPHPGAKRADWDELGESSFNHDDAVTAQLAGGQNWKKFARNMYFARAMSNGVRIYTPDVFYGAPVYVEGEISGSFEEASAEETVKPVEPKATNPDEAGPADDPVSEDQPAISEPQEAEIVQEQDGDDEQIARNVAKHLEALKLPDSRVRQLVRETTNKPFLRNCDHEDLVKLAEEIERIESGERVLPPEWFEKPVVESK